MARGVSAEQATMWWSVHILFSTRCQSHAGVVSGTSELTRGFFRIFGRIRTLLCSGNFEKQHGSEMKSSSHGILRAKAREPRIAARKLAKIALVAPRGISSPAWIPRANVPEPRVLA